MSTRYSSISAANQKAKASFLRNQTSYSIIERQGQITVVEIEPLREQMTKTIGEITQVQSQIEAKKEMVNKFYGATCGIEQERQEWNANEDSNAVSAVGEKAD